MPVHMALKHARGKLKLVLRVQQHHARLCPFTYSNRGSNQHSGHVRKLVSHFVRLGRVNGVACSQWICVTFSRLGIKALQNDTDILKKAPEPMPPERQDAPDCCERRSSINEHPQKASFTTTRGEPLRVPPVEMLVCRSDNAPRSCGARPTHLRRAQRGHSAAKHEMRSPRRQDAPATVRGSAGKRATV